MLASVILTSFCARKDLEAEEHRALESSPGQGPAEKLQDGPRGSSGHMEDPPLTKGQTRHRKDPWKSCWKVHLKNCRKDPWKS